MTERLEDSVDAPDTDEPTAIDEGMILDYITGQPIKATAKEPVRQRLARALLLEYGISVADMEPDFRMKIEGRAKKIDLAIFAPGTEHTQENIRRVVVCQKEPTNGKKTVKLRDHEQAKQEFELLHAAMRDAPNCAYGLWTNGLEYFFFKKEVVRFDVKFHPMGDWPLADETIGTRDVLSNARLRRADPEMLRIAFRRCHNFIHGNEGMPKDAAFWQFLYLIFAKIYDEKRSRSQPPQFWTGLIERTINSKPQMVDEQFDDEGRAAIRTRIEPLFAEVKRNYANIFRGNEEITLSDRALAFMVSELAKYDFGRTDVEAKGAAYQEIVGDNLRGDRGQYFTPRGAVKLMVAMLDPQPHERVLDPACGPGGFLESTLDHQNRRFHAEAKVPLGAESTAEFLSIQDRLADYVRRNLFGADFDQFLVRAAQMNMVMAANAEANLFHMNSLEFPNGHLTGVEAAGKIANLGTIDVVATNPPFGSDIPITDPNILRHFELAYLWERTPDGEYTNTGRLQSSVAPEVLFIERCVQWLKPGGRMGIVLPDGILGNPGQEYIRWWILRNCWVLASVDLPVEAFIVEANVNILTSLLFLKKKTDQQKRAEALGAVVDYPVFMAVAEKVGFDRRGNTLYKRSPDGEELVQEVEKVESIRIGGRAVERRLRRREKIIDTDLPYTLHQEFIPGPIAAAYHAFRQAHQEPGL